MWHCIEQSLFSNKQDVTKGIGNTRFIVFNMSPINQSCWPSRLGGKSFKGLSEAPVARDNINTYKFGTFSFRMRYYCSVVKLSNSLWPHSAWHTKLPCPSLSPGVCLNSCGICWTKGHSMLLSSKSCNPWTLDMRGGGKMCPSHLHSHWLYPEALASTRLEDLYPETVGCASTQGHSKDYTELKTAQLPPTLWGPHANKPAVKD